MFCAISGQVVGKGVFVPKTGLLYEDRVLRKALEANGGKCPVTGTLLDAEGDLVEVKTSPVTLPRPPSGSSFPALLGTLQNEWDSALLEQLSLRKELAETRKDLAAALYEREAASAVIARLLKENEELKAELEKGGAQNGPGASAKAPSEPGSAAIAEDASGLEESELAFRSAVGATRSALEKVRAERVKSFPKWTGADAPAVRWGPTQSLMPHKTSKPGVTCVAVDMFRIDEDSVSSTLAVSGGADGDIKVVDCAEGQVLGTLSKHSSRVNDLSLRGELLTSAGQDKTLIVWSGRLPTADGADGAGSMAPRHVIKAHSKGIAACPIHPSGAYVATVGLESAWATFDVETAARVTGLAHDKGDGLRCGRFHPDGDLFCTAGSSGQIHFFSMSVAPASGPAVAPLDHGAPVSALAFSENGYSFASAGEDGVVKLWDLRKLKVAATLGSATENASACSVQFDPSGNYLAVGDSAGGLAVWLKPVSKKGEWQKVVSVFEQKKAVVGLAFSPGSQGLWSASMDRSLKYFTCTGPV